MLAKANLECVNALAIPMQISEEQRKLLHWLTGALKLHQIAHSLQPNLQYLLELKSQSDFHGSRVVKISKYFGFSL